MRRATMRNQILAVSGTLTFLTTIVLSDLGCLGSSDTSPVATVTVTPGSSSIVAGARSS